MPLLISETVAENKLKHPTNLIVKHAIAGRGNSTVKNLPGRPNGSGNIDPDIKAMLAAIALTDGTIKTGKAFDIAPATISKYVNGQDSFGKPNQKVQEALDRNISVVREKVIDKILKHVDAITEDKITEAPLPILSKSASNLAGIFDKLREAGNTNNGIQQQFVFFGVKERPESNYNVIEVEASIT